MNKRREMAEIYGRGEMDLVHTGIREREYVCDDIGLMRGNGYGFRSLSHGYDHGVSVRDGGASTRFQRDLVLDDSRGVLRSVREDEHRSRFVSCGQNYDGLVGRPSRNVASYDHNDAELRGFRPNGVLEDSRGSEFARRGPNFDELLTCDSNGIDSRVILRSNGVREDTQISGFAEILLPLASGRNRNVAAYDRNDVDFRRGPRGNEVRDDTQIPRQNYDGLVETSPTPLRVRTRTMNELPIEDGRNYLVTERETPPCIERELPRQLYDDENGLGCGPQDGSRILTPCSQSSGRHTLFEGIASEGNYTVRERELLRAHYEEENGRKYLLEDGSHSLTPRSHFSGRRTPFLDVAMEGLPQEVQYRSSDGVGSASRIPSSRSSSYRHVLHSNGGGTSHPFSVEAISPRGEYPLSVHRPDDLHPENQRSRIVYREIVPESGYDNDQAGAFEIEAARGTLPRRSHAGYSHRDVHGDVIVEEEYFGRRNIGHPLHVASALDNSGGSRIAYEMVYDEANIDLRNSYPGHRPEDILGSLPREERISYGQDEFGRLVYVTSPRRNEVPVMDDNTWQISETRDFNLPEQPNTTRKRMHEFVDDMRDSKRIIVSSRGAMSYDDGHLRAEGDRGIGVSNRIVYHHGEPHSRAHLGMTITETAQPFSGLHRSHELSLSEPQESGRGDVKKRLTFPKAVSRMKQEANSRIKPSTRNTDASSPVKTYGKGKDTDSKKKPKSVPIPAVCSSAAPDPDVLDSGINGKKKQKLAVPDAENMNVALRSPHIDKSWPALKVKPLVDLPEDSQKFKEQVYKSFKECIWHLYRVIGLKERFMGKGTGGSLKCIICSSRAEFAEAKDVAAHSFSSLKVGYRAHHLGFHQALCVLMGWDSAVAPNCRWVCQSLSEHIVWTLKEDVIIWPPVVIVHISPAKNHQLNELGKETVELPSFLRDNGFIREIRSINENPGNPSIMVVKFNGTLPGYKEAERLHNFFSENKLGRVEVAQIDAAAEVVGCKLPFKTSKDELDLVDKREDDQEQVDKRKAEPPEFKADDNLIDERKDGDGLLDKRKVDQQLVDVVQDDQKPVMTPPNDQELIETAQDDHNPVVKTQIDQVLVETAQDDLKLTATAQVDQKLIDTAQGDKKPVVTAQNDQDRIDTTEEEQDHLTRTEYVQKSANKIADESLPLNKASEEQTPPEKIEPDQEPVHRAASTLYGYLGIIEDLNLLDQNITSHHCARSEKELRTFL